MFPVRSVETVITVAAARDQVGRLKLRQLILHSLQREKAQPSQLPYVELLSWIGEQEQKNLGAYDREQPVQERLAHAVLYSTA